MSLGWTGTMWLIQQNLPPLINTQTCAYGGGKYRVNTHYLRGPLVHRVAFDDSAETKMTSIKYLRRSYTKHSVHFPLCYFIDCGHNYPLFWSAALSEFPVCWTISTEGWLSRVIPQPEGTVNFPRTLIIISKPKWGGKKKTQLVHLCSGSHTDWPVS